MKQRIKRYSTLIVALVTCLLVANLWYQKSKQDKYYSGITSSKMMGLTKQQVINLVGTPTWVIDSQDCWVYQLGKDPGASIVFTSGKVTGVNEKDKKE